jgi:apolipoprotein D and lipocalin family protein
MSDHRTLRKHARPLAAATGLALLAAMIAQHAAAGPAPLSPPADFAIADLEGRWHILAHIPYFLERNRVAPTIEFVRREDGRLDELFTARKGSFDAPPRTFRQVTWPPDPSRPWELTTRIFTLFRANFEVLHVDGANGIALLGTEKRDKAWIFSRTPGLDDAHYRRLLEHFAAQGFDRSRILRIPQQRDDLGKPGYATIDD